MASERPAGLDFGTTTTLVASPGGLVKLTDDTTWMASLVGWDDAGRLIAGIGKDTEPEFAGRTVRSIKRSITSGETKARVELSGGPCDVSADDLMAAVLREAARLAAARSPELARSKTVRVGCPAMWDGQQRRRLLRVAAEAGIPVGLADLIDEPVAAGIAWLARRRPDTSVPLRVVVFDMGGGTLDVAVLDVRGVLARDVSVLSALGNTFAGDALDAAIAEDIVELLGVDLDALPHPARARLRLADVAREVKLALTTDTEFDVSLPTRLFGSGVEVEYTRERLEAAFTPLMDRAEETVIAALRTARLTEQKAGSPQEIRRAPLETLLSNVDAVVLSGGMARIPYVASRLRALFPAPAIVEFAVESTVGSTEGGPEQGPEEEPADAAAAPESRHLPWFVTPPGGTDYLFNAMAFVVIAALIAIGNLFFKLHALPERWAHRANPFQLEIVAVLSLVALFTHQHVFWVAALLLALVRFPDYGTPLRSMSESLARLVRRPPRPADAPRYLRPGTAPAIIAADARPRPARAGGGR